jgi:hypothetical protein
MKFSQKVKAELGKIRESGKEYKSALEYGVRYGTEDSSGAKSLIADRILANEELGGIFLRGVFVSCGNVNNPEKDYHLELTLPNREKCVELLDFAAASGLSLKQSSRGGRVFLYCKKCEHISDFLAYIGATRSAMELMNVIILKEIRSNVNRKVNCESANLEKTARAATQQIADIEFLLAEKVVLPESLREVAELRLNNVALSLAEIGAELNISKSGVNHKLKKISQIAEKLRKKT